jgi:hypothetical protein
MDPYMLYVLERQAQEMRDRAAPHTWHLQEAMSERTAARRSRRLAAVHAVVAMLRRHATHAPVPTGAGSRT